MLEHGGGIIAASRRYKIPVDQWLDLSTGISPIPYTVPPIDPELWRRLPQDQDDLLEAACRYYGVENVLPTCGSQAAIKMLPQLWAKSKARSSKRAKVGVLTPSYNEHYHAWSQDGHDVRNIAWDSVGELGKDFGERSLSGTVDDLGLDVLIVVNPNNPTAQMFSTEELLECYDRLSCRDGWLIVDEAFMDVTPSAGVIRHARQSGLIVLRSLGKFFGLSGARVGFVAAQSEILKQLEELLGPWTIAGPSRWAAQCALEDYTWQSGNRLELQRLSDALLQVLKILHLTPTGSTAYFHWLMHEQAEQIYTSLASRGILTRYFSAPSSIRLGLVRSDADLRRVKIALEEVLGEIGARQVSQIGVR